MFATFGTAGLIAELTRTNEKAKVGDFAVGIFCLLVALGTALAATAWSLRSPIPGLLKTVSSFFVFFGIYGCFSGVAKVIATGRTKNVKVRPSTAATLSAILVAVVGLATALVNLYAAFQALPPKP